MSQFGTHDVNVNAAVATTPTDRVRWGPIIAGFFAALCTLTILAILGVAVAGSTYDPGDSARAFGIGAGVWGAISMLLAFFIGGWLAARSAAVRGEANGVLNGSMVWVVTIPLLLWMIMGGLGAIFRTTGSAISTGVQSASNAADRAADRIDQQKLDDQARQASAKLQATTQQVAQAASDPGNQKAAANTTAKSAWWTLVSMLLGLGAAAAGGWVGSRDRLGERTHVHHTGPTGTTGTTTTDRV